MVTKFLNISTNERLSENSNILVPSQKAVKSYIASKSIQCDYVQSETPTGYSTGQLWLNTSDCKIYTATSGSAWNSGVAAEKDQLFTCNDLLYYYDGSDIKSYTILSILEQNENREIKTWLGTREEYDELDSDEYDSNTIYQVIETLNDYARLATQTEFNNSSNITAASPYQVNQALGNYLPLSGGNLNPSAVLRLTNSNNEVTALAFNTSGQLTISSDIYGNGQLNINNIVVRNGTIYKTNTSGATAIWSDTYATSSNFGIVKVDGTTITANNGVISSNSGTHVLVDNTTIIEDSDDVITTVAVQESNNNNAISQWVGTKQEYDSIITKESNKLYITTDEIDQSESLFADINLSNINNAGKIEVSKMAAPSTTFIDLTLGASGDTYTAVATGYVNLAADLAKTLQLYNLTAGSDGTMFSGVESPINYAALGVWLYVNKGDTFQAYYNIYTLMHFRFFYAEGSKSEAN